MKVTREVIRDLLPLYLAGEGSEDTRRLVDSFLEGDPDFDAEAKAAANLGLEGIPMAMAPDHETRTLARTRFVLRMRGSLMGFAIFLTLFPFSVIQTDEMNWFTWRDAPEVAAPALLAGIALWLAYLATGRRLRTTPR